MTESYPFHNNPGAPQHWVLLSDGITPFFSSKSPGVFQAHHIIPSNVFDNNNLQVLFDAIAAEGYDHQDYKTNGQYLPSTPEDSIRLGVAMHSGSHPRYDEFVTDRLTDIQRQFTDGEITAAEAKAKVNGLQEFLKFALVEGPDGRPILFLNEADPRANGRAAAHNEAARLLWSLEDIEQTDAFKNGAKSLPYFPVDFEKDGNGGNRWNLDQESRAQILMRDLVVRAVGTGPDAQEIINSHRFANLVASFGATMEAKYAPGEKIPFKFEDFMDEMGDKDRLTFAKLAVSTLTELDDLDPRLTSHLDEVLNSTGNVLSLRAMVDTLKRFYDPETGKLNLPGLDGEKAVAAGMGLAGVAYAGFKVAFALDAFGGDTQEFRDWLTFQIGGAILGIPIAKGVLALAAASPIGVFVMFSLIAVGSYFELRELVELAAAGESPPVWATFLLASFEEFESSMANALKAHVERLAESIPQFGYADGEQVAFALSDEKAFLVGQDAAFLLSTGGDDIAVHFGHGIVSTGGGEDFIVAIKPDFVPEEPDPNNPGAVLSEQRLIIDAGAGNDKIFSLGGQGPVIFGGAGDDTIFSWSLAAELHGGEGADHFWWSPGALVADGKGEDRLSLFGALPLTGGIGFGGEEIEWARDLTLPFVRYARNIENELVVNIFGKEMFIADYVGGPGAPENTLGVFIARLQFFFHRIIDGPPSNVEAAPLGKIIEAIFKSMGIIPADDPLVLDLDGDGVEFTTQRTSSAYFDLDGDFFGERTGWVRPDDGLLAIDLDGNGKITDISELFGAPDVSGFSELRALDDNLDGLIDSQDSTFGQLMVWRDLDQDAISDPGELFTLADLGITSFSLADTEINQGTASGNTLRSVATFTRSDLSTGNMYDALLDSSQWDSRYLGDAGAADWAAALPDAKGYGLFTGLRLAASKDFRLAETLESIAPTLTSVDLAQLVADAAPIRDAWSDANPASRELTPVLLRSDASGVTRLDYGVYVEDGSGGYWQLKSGAAVLDGTGTAIARPTLEDVLAQQTPAGDAWRLEQSWSPDRASAPAHRPAAPYRVSVDANGVVTVLDHAIQETDASGSYWRLASGADVLDGGGLAIARPTLADVLAQSVAAGEEWRVEDFAGAEPDVPSQDFVVVYFADKVYDYSVWFTGSGGGYWASARALKAAADAGLDAPEGPSGATLQAFSDAVLAGPDGASLRVETFDNEKAKFAVKTAGVDLDQLPSLSAGLDGANVVDYDVDVGQYNQFLQALLERHDFWTESIAVRLAAQSGLASFFQGVVYDADKDLFLAATTRELVPLYESIFTAAPADAAGALDYLAAWRPILDVVYADFQRHNPGPMSQGFIFSNVVAAYESRGLAAAVADAADILGVEKNRIIHDTTDGATVEGTAGSDLFYVSSGNQTFRGGLGADTYVVGRGFGQDVIDDVEGLFGRKADTLRFADIASSEVTATRNGIDLILTVDATGDRLTIKSQFAGITPTLFGGDVSDDNGVGEIIFADGVVWDPVDIAYAVSHPLATDDLIVGTPTFDVLDGGTGNDILRGGTASDIYIYNLGYGNDRIEDRNGNILIANTDLVQFGPGIARDDLIFDRVGASSDLVITFAGSPSDQLTIKGQFGATNTWIFGVEWFERVEMLMFEDYTAMTWEDVMDKVLADKKTDGADDIYGFYYNDRLDGGLGNDYLSGGDLNDTYVFARGYGHDIVEDNQSNILSPSVDRIEFGADIGTGDIEFLRNGDESTITLKIAGTTDQITLQNQYSVVATGVFGDYYFDRVEEFAFTDGSNTVWSHDFVRRQILQQASTSGDDIIYGFQTPDLIDGGAGNDTLAGGAYSDTYIFGRGYGADTILEDRYNILLADRDRVEFLDLTMAEVEISRDREALIFTITDTGESLTVAEQYDRRIIGGQWKSVESFAFTDGEIAYTDVNPEDIDLVGDAGNNTLIGTSFAETIIGGAGNDILQGGNDGDTYIFNVGDGADTITDFQNTVFWNNADTVEFGTGITTENIAFAKDGNDLLVTIDGHSDTLRIVNQFGANWYRIERFEVLDPLGVLTVWSDADIRERLAITLTGEGDDVIDPSVDIQDGRGGNDTLNGGSQANTFLFGLGYDSDVITEAREIFANAGAVDKVVFDQVITAEALDLTRQGNDIIFSLLGTADQLRIVNGLGDREVEEFHFADLSVWDMARVRQELIKGSDGDDKLLAFNNSDDRLDGGAGSDDLQGGTGNDTYIFDFGYGHDAAFDTGGFDVLEFGALIVPDIVTLAIDGQNLRIGLDGFDDTLVVQGMFGAAAKRIEEFRFADGRVWSFDDVRGLILGRVATDRDDVVTGYGDRDDRLEGGRGQDLMSGLGGADSYVFNKGDGQDLIDDNGAGAGDQLAINGYAPDEVIVRRVAADRDDVRLSFVGSDDEITIRGALNEASADAIEEIIFEDGTLWTAGDLRARISVDAASNADDVLYGFSTDDTLAGGLGDDVLTGRGGSDTYVFNRGDGYEVIDDNGTGDADRLEIRGYVPGDVRVRPLTDGSPNALLSFANSDDRILILGGLTSDAADAIEAIVFDDGTTWTLADIQAQVLVGSSTDFADTITGYGGNDTLAGGLGNDKLYGGLGSDTYVFARGDGSDLIDDNGNGGTDRVLIKGYLPSEVTVVRSGLTSVVLTFAGTNDRLRIVNTLEDDVADRIEEIIFEDDPATVWTMATLRARILEDSSNAGNNAITGFVYNDTLEGGAGDDWISGRDGSDTYVFRRGDGRDVVEDNGNLDSDTLRIHDYLPSEVSVSRDRYNGNSAVLQFAGTDDEIRIVNTLSQPGDDHIERIEFDDGTVWDMQYLRNEIVSQAATDGNNGIGGFAFSETLAGGLGNDWLSGGSGADTYVFNRLDGQDTIDDNGNGGGDRLVIHGYASTEVTFLQDRYDADTLLLRFAGTDDSIRIYRGLAGGNDDTIEQFVFDGETPLSMADVQARLVLDSAGVTAVFGGGGNDVLEPGPGDHDIFGHNGSDDYIFNRGDGRDRIEDNGWQDNDRIVIRGYTASEVSVGRFGDTVILRFAGTDDELHLINAFVPTNSDGIEAIVFDYAGGPTWNMAQLRSRYLSERSTDGDDNLVGFWGNNLPDILDGGLGNDNLQGGNGSDTYIFERGDGRDRIDDNGWQDADEIRIKGYTPDEVIASRSGTTLVLRFVGTDDELRIINNLPGDNTYGIERITFLNADDTVAATWFPADYWRQVIQDAATDGNDSISGYIFDETYAGGLGDDFLSGGDGSDTYRFAIGDGRDTIDDNGYEDNDRVEITGYLPGQVTVTRDGATVTLHFGDGSDSLTIVNTLHDDLADRIEQIVFLDDGTTWTMADLRARVLADETASERLIGHPTDDILTGGVGDDYLSGRGGSDRYVFNRGDGQDVIHDAGNGGTDRLEIHGYDAADATIRRLEPNSAAIHITFAGTGDRITILDTLNGGTANHIEQIAFYGSDGLEDTVWTLTELLARVAEDAATDGDDLITGTGSDDVLAGKAGSDVIDGGLGADTYLYARGDGDDRIEDLGSAGDRVRIQGYLPSDVTVGRSPPNGLDLVLTFADSGDRIVIANSLQDDSAGVEQILFDDDPATVWTMADLRARIVQESGSAGDETVWGFDGADTLVGGRGNDTLSGRDGSDTYVFARGDGDDVVDDNGFGDVDRLEIQGYTPDETAVGRWYKAADDLVLTFAGTDDRIVVRNTLAGDSADTIEEIAFIDSLGQEIAVWAIADVDALLANNAPVAQRDSYFTVLQEQATVINAGLLLANDFDADGDPIRIVAAKNPEHGSVALDANGNVVFTIDNSFAGITTFTYTISDGRNGLADGIAYVRVEPLPVALDDTGLVTAEETTLIIPQARLFANDRDGDLLIMGSVTNAVNGSVVLAGNGDVLFTPTTDFNGTASFVYQASTPTGGLATATAFITVTPVNDAPIALNDSGFSTPEDEAITITAASLLQNDIDIDGDTLTIASVQGAVNGSAVLDANNNVIFTPSTHHFGDASFTYTVSDGQGGTSQAIVAVAVTAVNDAPLAVNDVGIITSEDVPLVVTAAELLANDSDPDGDPLTITRVFDGTGINAILRANNTIDLTPNGNFNGPGTFSYEVSDSQGGLSIATVAVDVTPVNDAPVVNNEMVAGTEDQVLTIAPIVLLLNDFDVDGDPLTISSVSNAANGTVALDAGGSIVFTPTPDFWGIAGFDYVVSDGQGGVAAGRATVDVAPVNDAPPVAMPDTFSGTEDTPLLISAADILANDTDIDNDTLTIVSVSTVGIEAYGATVTLTAEGDVLFTPAADYFVRPGFSAPRFKYVVSDGADGTDEGTVSVNVQGVNDAPVAVDDAATGTSLDAPLVVRISDLLANDVDVDFETPVFVSAQNASIGTVTVEKNQANLDTWIVLTAPLGHSGPVSFDYTIADGLGVQSTATVTATIGAAHLSPLVGTAIDDLIVGTQIGDVIHGLAGQDILRGAAGDDTLRGGDDADVLDGGAGFDFVDYSDSNIGVRVDISSRVGLGGYAEGDLLSGIEGVIGTSFGDELFGDVADNTLLGGAGFDDLDGAEGADTLRGEAGNDTLVGGAGADVLDGGEGIDKADYSASDLAVTVSLAAGTGLGGHAQGDTLTGIENLEGSLHADTLTGDVGDNELVGGRGTDQLVGGAGNDRLDGGRDGDSLDGGAGIDAAVYTGSAEGVTIALDLGAAAGGDAQGDTLTGIEDLVGSFHDDSLRGDDGANRLQGGEGADWLDGGLGADILDGGLGIDTADYSRSTAGVTVNLSLGTGLGGHAEGDTLSGIEVVIGSGHDDQLIGSDGAETLSGGLGNDTLAGGAGGDTYLFGNGDGSDTATENGATVDVDRLSLATGILAADVLLLEQGTDLLVRLAGGDSFRVTDHFVSGQKGLEEIAFADGTVWDRTTIYDKSRNHPPSDILLSNASVEENAEADTVVGTLSSIDPDLGDTATFALVNDAGGRFKIVGDEVRVADGVLLDFETLASHDIVVRATDSGGLTIDKTLTIVLTDLNEIATAGNDTIYGTPGADTIDGLAGNDTIYGRSGNDTLFGRRGADTLEGGPGNDTLYGEDESDTYVFRRGDGIDVIEENGYYDTDRLVIHGYAPGEVTPSRTADSSTLVLTFAGTSDRITILNTLDESRYDGLEQIVFDDGTLWTMATLRARLVAEATTPGDDLIYGFAFNETLLGGEGNDTLFGRRGADTLEGGPGNDTLYGGDESDTYVFSRGDGIDVIEENGYYDTDRLVIHGYGTEDVILGESAIGGANLVLTFAGTDDRITAINTLPGSRYDTIEQFEFDDGTIWTPADFNARLIAGTAADDVLAGNQFGDHIDGGAGNDTLSGWGGHDRLQGGDGNDVLNGGAGNDQLFGGIGSDTFVFATGDGADTVNDFVAGAGSDDVLSVGGLGYAALAEVLADTVQSGADAVITNASGDSITLVGVAVSGLHEDDFLFA